MKIDFDQIRELLEVFGQTDMTELTIESGEEKITIKKSAPQVSAHLAAPLAPARAEGPPPAVEPRRDSKPLDSEPEVESKNGLVPITSPMVGTFYRSPSPSAPPFVDVGDIVTVGQTVCIIEAMKLMNDLPAEVSGRLVRICVENGTTVEYGQPLFMLDPKG